MAEVELCRVCDTRKPKRSCPGVRGEICSQCCGQEREESIDCPLDCEYLIEARKHEKARQFDPKDVPYSEVQVSEDFLQRNDPLFGVMGKSLVRAALQTSAIDHDVQECLEAAIRTYRTLESGLYYETKPSSAYAGAIQQLLAHDIAEFRRIHHEQTGVHSFRDTDVLGLLVFYLRIARHLDNARRRGRSFIQFLLERFPLEPEPGTPQTRSSLIV